MRQSLVVGNWKMNGSSETAEQLVANIVSGAQQLQKTEIGVCVPFIYIPQVSQQLASESILLGSQNIADQASGAFTGEISATMLKDFNCDLALVGHSERRALYGESDELVAARYAQALAGDLRPVLCIGETLEEREQEKTFDVVAQQLAAVLDTAGVASLSGAVIAYEPVWAIGTGKTASPEQAQEVHAFIRQNIAKLDQDIANKVQILYGGSVKADNAETLFAMADIDGGLIGGASLDADSFLAICNAANH